MHAVAAHLAPVSFRCASVSAWYLHVSRLKSGTTLGARVPVCTAKDQVGERCFWRYRRAAEAAATGAGVAEAAGDGAPGLWRQAGVADQCQGQHGAGAGPARGGNCAHRREAGESFGGGHRDACSCPYSSFGSKSTKRACQATARALTCEPDAPADVHTSPATDPPLLQTNR